MTVPAVAAPVYLVPMIPWRPEKVNGKIKRCNAPGPACFPVVRFAAFFDIIERRNTDCQNNAQLKVTEGRKV